MDKASANLEIVHGNSGDITVFDVCFLRGAKASHTLSAPTTAGVWVYVDIEKGGSSPVALTLIHRSDAAEPKYVEVPPSGPEPLYGNIAKLAARVIELDGDGKLPKLFTMLRGKPVPSKTFRRVALPLPATVRWRPD